MRLRWNYVLNLWWKIEIWVVRWTEQCNLDNANFESNLFTSEYNFQTPDKRTFVIVQKQLIKLWSSYDLYFYSAFFTLHFIHCIFYSTFFTLRLVPYIFYFTYFYLYLLLYNFALRLLLHIFDYTSITKHLLLYIFYNIHLI